MTRAFERLGGELHRNAALAVAPRAYYEVGDMHGLAGFGALVAVGLAFDAIALARTPNGRTLLDRVTRTRIVPRDDGRANRMLAPRIGCLHSTRNRARASRKA